MINKDEMSIEYLKDLFVERYMNGEIDITDETPEVLVVMTKEQFSELYNNIVKSNIENALLLIDETMTRVPSEGEILFTRIHIPFVCEFIIEIGEEFSFKLLGEEQYGDEDL